VVRYIVKQVGENKHVFNVHAIFNLHSSALYVTKGRKIFLYLPSFSLFFLKIKVLQIAKNT